MTATTIDQLSNELHRLGIHFLRFPDQSLETRPLSPVELLASLASHSEARMRLALIPLLLWHPEYADAVHLASRRLASSSRLVLQCYYTAAVLLQQMYSARLQTLGASLQPLPDLYSVQLGLPISGSPEQCLAVLANHQSQFSGQPFNWFGTYQHAAESFLAYRERELAWIT
ncbi:MAG: hypothetical protein JXB15_02165 [Anaerolineales bacterium]|nr:hypothetical protein [Anaerolineales bacterium]